MTWTVRKTSSALMDRYSRIPGTSKTWSVEKLSKAESSYRQITEDTDAGEKRMLLTESKNLVVFIFHTYQVDE